MELANIRLAEFKKGSNMNGKIHSINAFSPKLIQIFDSSVFVQILYVHVNYMVRVLLCSFFYTYSALSNSSMFSLLIFFEVAHLWSLNFRFHFLSLLSGHRSYSCLMT